jgi:hypothetical protein
MIRKHRGGRRPTAAAAPLGPMLAHQQPQRWQIEHLAGLDSNLWVPESRSWVLSCEFVGEAIGPR